LPSTAYNTRLATIPHFITKGRKEKRERQMAQIELTQNEIDLLRGILQKSLSELSLEIAFSDRKDFRNFRCEKCRFDTLINLHTQPSYFLHFLILGTVLV
jgi:hypothetical protein